MQTMFRQPGKPNPKKNTMKKLILTSVCAVTLAVNALGDGTVNWTSSTFVTFQTNSTTASTFGDTPPLFGGSQGATASATTGRLFYFALLYNTYNGSQLAAPTTVAQLNTWKFSGLMATNSNTAGRFAPIGANTAATVPWATGFTNSIMMVGWSANLGSTWNAVSNLLNNPYGSSYALFDNQGFIGTSTTGYIAPSDVNPGAILFGNSPNAYGLPINSPNTQLFQLVYIPEPGTMALAGLGGATLLAFRRRKK